MYLAQCLVSGGRAVIKLFGTHWIFRGTLRYSSAARLLQKYITLQTLVPFGVGEWVSGCRGGKETFPAYLLVPSDFKPCEWLRSEYSDN